MARRSLPSKFTAIHGSKSSTEVKGRKLIEAANLSQSETPESALDKLAAAAGVTAVESFDLVVSPLAFTLLERPADAADQEITATVTANCTYDPWDGCTPDGDF